MPHDLFKTAPLDEITKELEQAAAFLRYVRPVRGVRAKYITEYAVFSSPFIAGQAGHAGQAVMIPI